MRLVQLVPFRAGYQSKMLRRWKALPDVKVVVTSRDVSRQSAAEELIAYAQTIAPVGGVFHLAMVSDTTV